MPDVAVKWNAKQGIGDWALAGTGITDLLTDDTIETEVWIRLMTDRRAPADFIPPDGSGDPRGCWIDTFEGEQIGSHLWLLDRAKKSNAASMLGLARQYCLDALNPMIPLRASRIDVAAQWRLPPDADKMNIQVTLFKPASTVPSYLSFSWPPA